MTLPYSPTRVPVVPVHSPIPPYGALVPPSAPSSHELTDPSFCSLIAKRCALVLRAALPLDEFLEQRFLLIEVHDQVLWQGGPGDNAGACGDRLGGNGRTLREPGSCFRRPAEAGECDGEIDLAPFRVPVRGLQLGKACKQRSTKRAMRAAAPGSSLSLAAESTMPVATVCISPLPSIRLG